MTEASALRRQLEVRARQAGTRTDLKPSGTRATKSAPKPRTAGSAIRSLIYKGTIERRSAPW